MSKKMLTLCLDERWYDALCRHLRGESVEDKLEHIWMRSSTSCPTRCAAASAKRSGGRRSRHRTALNWRCDRATCRRHSGFPVALDWISGDRYNQEW